MSIARRKQTSPVFWKLLRVLVFNNDIHGATHICGHTLDVVLSRPEDNLIMDCTVGVRLSDHHNVDFQLMLDKAENPKQVTTNRNFRTIDTANFQKELKLKFNNIIAGVDYIDCLTEAFEECTINSLDHFAPVSMKTRKTRIRQICLCSTSSII